MAKSNLAKIIPIRAGMADNATAVDRLEKSSKEIDIKQQDRDEKLVKSNEKLVTNLEKLANAIKTGAISPNSAPTYKDGGAWDQRSVKDQAKDSLLGRMGSDGKRDQFDKDSLKYKFGSLKGLSRMNNFVKEDSFVGNLIGRREDKLKRSDTLTKMNPQMKNLKQFGGSDEKVREYYNKQYTEQFAPAQAKAQGEKYKLDSMLQSGINPDELAKSVGGKRQIKATQAAQADELLKDKFRKQEVKGTLDGMAGAVGVPSTKPSADSNVIPFPTSAGVAKEGELENIRLMSAQNDMMSKINENTASQPIYLEEWREETKRKVEYDAQLLQAVREGGGGGGIMDLASSAMDAIGGKGKGAASKVGGMLKGAGGFLAKRAGPLAAGAAILGGGVTAYQGYNAAEEKQQRGEITKEQATVEKGGAVGEGAGTAVGGTVGALKGAAVGAAVGSVIPVVGTAIGGLVGAAIGGIGGSYLGGKAGKFMGETGGKIKNWFSSSNPDKSGAESKVQSMTATPQAQTEPKVAPVGKPAQAMEKVSGKPTSDKYVDDGIKRIQKKIENGQIKTQADLSGEISSITDKSQKGSLVSDKLKMEVEKRGIADKVAQMTTDNAAAREAPAQTNNVSTNVSNTSVKQSSTQAIKPPIRNQDSSFSTMVGSRYVY